MSKDNVGVPLAVTGQGVLALPLQLLIIVLLGTKQYTLRKVIIHVLYIITLFKQILLDKNVSYSFKHDNILVYLGYETVAVGDMEDLASEEESDTSNLDDETRETIRAQAAAAAADAIAEEQIIHADTPDRYIAATHFVTLYVIHIFVITEKELELSTLGKDSLIMLN